jgi:hypothetical protein
MSDFKLCVTLPDLTRPEPWVYVATMCDARATAVFLLAKRPDANSVRVYNPTGTKVREWSRNQVASFS